MTVTPRIKLDAPLEDIQRSMNVITTAVSRLSDKAERLVDTDAANKAPAAISSGR